MKITVLPYQLTFRFPFRIAHGTRTQTDTVFVKLEHEGFTAWGEAALPPYLSQTVQSVSAFIQNFPIGLSNKKIADWFDKLSTEQSNMPGKAALDIALWNLKSQMENKSVGELLNITPAHFPLCTYTIGVCFSLEEMQEKVQHGLSQGFQIFKLKLINENPLDTISWFLQTTDKPFMVDANQSWTNNAELSGHYINLMFKDAGCLLMEQPFEKENWEKTSLLKTVSEVPIYADESCQRISDLEKVAENFSGVNIKLMKCGGITEAYQMIKKARQLKLKILIGCMSESSVGCTAAAHLSPLTDYADLDGPYLITNDPFDGMKIENGRIKLNVLKEKISLV